ncbi:DNA repair protein RecO [Candidatus Pacearchaeota archaeon]|nr:DNA repair protein RecO [Candidatus Pacearchaeota archaeon]
MNKHFSTTGIVIRKVDFGEADRIVTVLTEDMGKIDCIAKGARRLKSRFCGRLELFSEIQITCYQGQSLACLNEAHLIDGFPDVKETDRHRVLFYIAELTHRLIQDQQQIEGVYPLLHETINHLKEENKTDVILHTYLVKLLTLSGFLSPWNQCATCNETLNIEHPIHLGDDANVICQSCSNAAHRRIEAPLIKWVNFMQHYPLPNTLKVQVNEKDHQSVWLWLQGVLGNLLSTPMKSESFLQSVA